MGIFRQRAREPEFDGADLAAQGAAIAASTILKVYGHTVTYVVDDLHFVDRATADLAATGSIDDKQRTIAMFGFLVGEILVRNDGAEWIALNEEQRQANGVPVLLKLVSGVLANPIAATIRNAEMPDTRSAVAFREQAIQLRGRPPST